jgi:hypothetical protein
MRKCLSVFCCNCRGSLADRIAVIDHGWIVAEGTAAALRPKPSLISSASIGSRLECPLAAEAGD